MRNTKQKKIKKNTINFHTMIRDRMKKNIWRSHDEIASFGDDEEIEFESFNEFPIEISENELLDVKFSYLLC